VPVNPTNIPTNTAIYSLQIIDKLQTQNTTIFSPQVGVDPGRRTCFSQRSQISRVRMALYVPYTLFMNVYTDTKYSNLQSANH
jgi:hypothetical protein